DLGARQPPFVRVQPRQQAGRIVGGCLHQLARQILGHATRDAGTGQGIQDHQAPKVAQGVPGLQKRNKKASEQVVHAVAPVAGDRCAATRRRSGHWITNSWQRCDAQLTISRSQSGSGCAFCCLKSTQQVVAPPAAWITPGMSVRSIVAQLSNVVRAGSLTYIFSSTSPGYTSCR